MAELISKGQPVRVGVMYPKSVYSRVVSCVAYIKGDPDARGYTPVLGERVWLRGVDVWPSRDYSAVVGAGISFRILHGSGKPATAVEIREWTNILPVYWPDGIGRDWTQGCPFFHMRWNVNRLFEGGAQRFGIWLEVSGFVPVLEFVACFEISEV